MSHVHNVRRINPLRIDPTRTASLRRAFEKQLASRFARLRLKIHTLLVDEDSLGLLPDPALHPTFSSMRIANQLLINCGGPGSGVPGPCPTVKGLSKESNQALGKSLGQSLKIGDHILKLRSIEVREGTAESTGFGYSNGHVIITPKVLESANTHDPEKTKAFYEGSGIDRNTSVEDAKNPAEYIALGVAHEIGHHAETALGLDLQRAIRDIGGVPREDMLKLSGFAASHVVELFAETHAFMTTGREAKVPESVKRFYHAAIQTSLPENTIPVFLANEDVANCGGVGSGVPGPCPSGVTDKIASEGKSFTGRLKAAGAKAVEIEHALKEGIAGAISKLPQPVQYALAATYHTAFAGWTASQALAERVAIERGSTPEQARALRGALAAADIAAFKPMAVTLKALDASAAVQLATWVIPPATGAYLAYSTVRNPIKTMRAAKGLVRDAIRSIATKLLDKVSLVPTTNAEEAFAVLMAEALEAHNYDDWYIALFTQALSSDLSPQEALALADKVYEANPVNPSEGDDVDADAEALFSVGTPVTNAGRWQFNSTPEKVKAFKAWLKTQIATEITGRSEQDVWEAYVRLGLQKGAGRAFDDTRRPQKVSAELSGKSDFYLGTKDEFLRSAFNQPVAKEKVQLLAGRSFDELENVTGDMANRMTRDLTDGLVRGESPREIARTLDHDLDIGRNRSLVIARTEIIRAHAEGQLMALEQLGVEEVGVAVEWSTAGDDKVCELCAPLEGVVLKIDEAKGMLPRHPNCVLPGNFIQGRILAGLKGFYSGECVEILTSHGARFSLTIKHPVFSEYGLVDAGKIKEGENLLSYLPDLKVALSSDIENRPTLIENIFKTFDSVSIQEAARSFDLNGDEQCFVGKIDVVTSQLLLGKQVAQQRQDMNKVFLMLASNSSMSRRGLSNPLLWSHSRPLQCLGLTLIAGSNSTIDKSASNNPTSYTKGFRKSILGLPRQISSTDFSSINIDRVPGERRFGHASELDSVFSKPAGNGVSFNPNFIPQLLERFPSKVTLDKVLHVRRFHYSGSVYDLESTPGYFTITQGTLASTIIVNCRCAWLPANVGEDSENQKDTKAAIGRALETSVEEEGGFESSRWVGADLTPSRERPESQVGNYLRDFSEAMSHAKK